MGCSLHVEKEIKLEKALSSRYEIIPHTTCPKCGHVFDPEKEKGWSDDPRDCSITCPQCGHRFSGELEIRKKEGGIYEGRYPFLCPNQTLYKMRQLLGSRGRLGEKFLHDRHPRIFFSMIKNFGDYPTARKQVTS